MSKPDDSTASPPVQANSGNDERGTPPWVIRRLKQAIGEPFDLDPCSGADASSITIAKTTFTAAVDGTAQSWAGYRTVFVNPPYSDLYKWLEKVWAEATAPDEDAPSLIICLVPGYTDTQWFQQYGALADYLCLIEGRLSFHGTDGDAPFPSLLLAFGDDGDVDDAVLATMANLGAVYSRAEITAASEQDQLDSFLESSGGNGDRRDGTPGIDVQDPVGLTHDTAAGDIDFRTVGLGDYIEIHLDESVPGQHHLPDKLAGHVVTGERATDERTQTPDEWQTLLCVDSTGDSETYICLQQDPDDLRNVVCTVSEDTKRWSTVSLDTLCRQALGGRPVIEPHGPGTSYIC